MSKRSVDREAGAGGPQTGPIGMGSDPHQLQDGADRNPEELADEFGAGGQRHPGGSSRDPVVLGRRTREAAGG